MHAIGVSFTSPTFTVSEGNNLVLTVTISTNNGEDLESDVDIMINAAPLGTTPGGKYYCCNFEKFS